MVKKTEMDYLFDVELSDRETFLIGKIVTQWAAMEHEVFHQTLMTYLGNETEMQNLPKEMNNMQFSSVIALWKLRVVDKAPKRKSNVLSRQYDAILVLQDSRNALIHGMSDWSMTDLDKVSVVRVRRKEIITTHFTADDLAEFYKRLAIINFKIRYPGGSNDFFIARMNRGVYMSRRFLSAVSDSPVADDWLPPNLKPD